MPALDDMHRTISNKVMFILSAIPFCCGIFFTEKCLYMPSSWHSWRNYTLLHCLNEVSSYFFPYFSPCFSFTPQTTPDFPLVLHCICPTSPKVIIYKWHKVVVTSNRCCIGRSPDICVNIIQNLPIAISCSAKSHLGLLSNDAIFTKFQFACTSTFQ